MALPLAPGRRATYEDLEALPEHLVGEIIDGELVASPRPGAAHSIAETHAAAVLVPKFHFGDGGPGGWWILVEPELHLGENVLVPDLAGWRKERMPEDPTSLAHFDLPPDWLCEILSPSTARLDRVRKLPAYARAGVSHAWLLDPIAKTLEVLRLESGKWVVAATFGGDDVVRAEPFDAVEIDLKRFWG